MQERRLGFRIPFETMVTTYVVDERSPAGFAGGAGVPPRGIDRPVRGLASNLSDSGINLSAVSMLAPPPGAMVTLELELPDAGESIWASGRICYRKDDRLASGLGVRFLAMARCQARLLRDFCIEMRRKNLGLILSRIRA